METDNYTSLESFTKFADSIMQRALYKVRELNVQAINNDDARILQVSRAEFESALRLGFPKVCGLTLVIKPDLPAT